MRINVYAEELTSEVELVTKTVTDDEFGTRTFYGVRVYLESPDVLHSSPKDDDRSAVTFWIPWTKASGQNGLWVRRLFEAMAQKAGEVDFMEREKGDA